MPEIIIEPVLGVHGIYDTLKAAGYNVTLRSVRRLISEKKIPTHRGPDNKTRFIRVSELQDVIARGIYPER